MGFQAFALVTDEVRNGAGNVLYKDEGFIGFRSIDISFEKNEIGIPYLARILNVFTNRD